MPTFTKQKPSSEKELHGIIQAEIDALEQGLDVLKYEFTTGKGTADFLCVDSGGTLVIIEVKLGEDENVLFQALRYFSEVDRDRYVIAQMFSSKEIDPDQNPRIVIIAERFSDDLRRLSTLVVPDIELFEYTVMIGPNEEKGIIFHAVSLPKIIDPVSKPRNIEDLKNYVKDETLRGVIDNYRHLIKEIGEGIEEYATQGYIGFKFRGRQFAWIGIQRQSFDVGALIIDEKGERLDQDFVRVESEDEDCTEIIDKINDSYQNLGVHLSS